MKGFARANSSGMRAASPCGQTVPCPAARGFAARPDRLPETAMRDVGIFLGKCYKYLCVLIISLMVLIVFVNTTLRYGFNSGLVENEEVLRYLFVWASFLGIVAVYREHRHIAVTMLTDWLSPVARTRFRFFTNLLVLYALYVLIDGSLMYMEASRTTLGQMTNPPCVYLLASAVICGCACGVIVLIDMIGQLRAWRTGQTEE
jgi:TRAP-type C4-dicarboxylate transport system permease small subunit